MVVQDLCELYIESGEEMEIYSLSKSETVFKGEFSEAEYCEFAYEEIASFGIESGKIVINID